MRIALLLVLGVLSASVYGGKATGTVQSLFFNTDNFVVTFRLSGAVEEVARCNDKGMFSVDTSRPGGESILITLLEAKKHGYTVVAGGRNLCGLNRRAEDLLELTVQ